MKINNAILHILDFNSDLCVFSQKELDFTEDSIRLYIEKHLKHLLNDAGQKQGTFMQNSKFARDLHEYVQKKIKFVELSTLSADVLYEQISNSDKLDSADFLVVDFTEGEMQYIALLLMTSKIAYTHQVMNDDGNIHNEIIRHYAILPNTSQKIDSYAIININNFSIGFADKNRFIGGKDVFVFPEVLLQCTSNISSKEVLKVVNKIATKIAEDHGVNTAVVLSKAKNYLVENAEIGESFSPIELGREIFANSETMQNEFKTQISDAQLPQDVKVQKSLALRTGRNHKIKTDTGIEITFPAEYFENHDYIEFINNPNGTISIELKNIGNIINK